MKRTWILVLALVFLTNLTPGCGPAAEPCHVQARSYVEQVDRILVEWDTAYAVILSTPREALAEPLDDLDAIQRQAAALKPPECVQQIHSKLLEGMGLVVEGARIYMAPVSGSAAYFRIQAGQERIDDFRVELEKLKAGQPPYN